jgi:hypothetical protein
LSCDVTLTMGATKKLVKVPLAVIVKVSEQR